jgi:F-type H+-transporting ATPase subunit O
MYLSQLYTHSESFRLFTENAGVGQKEIKLLNQALLETASFHEVTMHFLVVLAENKRLIYIKEIASKYQKLYQQFNKEEKITIISAEELNSKQQSEVLSALQANPQNTGKAFTIEYQIDASIGGGLQMYTESEFMDMSLQSRLSRINEEVAKLTL